MPALLSSASPPPFLSSPMPPVTITVTDLLATPPSLVTVNPACSQSLHPIDNQHFQGRLMIKLRPPHCNNQQRTSNQPHNQTGPCASAATATTTTSSSIGTCGCCDEFFSRHPSVQLELAVQGRFLSPVSRVWMGAELGGSSSPFTLSLPFFKRAAIKLMANLIATFIPNVKWTLGDKVRHTQQTGHAQHSTLEHNTTHHALSASV